MDSWRLKVVFRQLDISPPAFRSFLFGISCATIPETKRPTSMGVCQEGRKGAPEAGGGVTRLGRSGQTAGPLPCSEDLLGLSLLRRPGEGQQPTTGEPLTLQWPPQGTSHRPAQPARPAGECPGEMDRTRPSAAELLVLMVATTQWGWADLVARGGADELPVVGQRCQEICCGTSNSWRWMGHFAKAVRHE